MSKKNIKKILLWFLLFIVIVCLLVGLFYRHNRRNFLVDKRPFMDNQGRIIVVASSFPVYDFARVIGGERVSVSLILPPGKEAHSFRPTDTDLKTIAGAGIFFYTSSLMEPWAPDLVKQVSSRTSIVGTADGLADASGDPHVWLDFSKAQIMVTNIAKTYEMLDPEHSSYYQENATNYQTQLAQLDTSFATGLQNCRFKGFVSGGHYAFGYLAKRYGLEYQAAQGFIPDTTPAGVDIPRLLQLAQELKDKKEPYVYYEELIMPSLAEMLRQASGARLMPLNAAHNVARYDITSGVTFIKLMEADLQTLRLGLDCH